MKEKNTFTQITCPNTKRMKRYEMTSKDKTCPACGSLKDHYIVVITEDDERNTIKSLDDYI